MSIGGDGRLGYAVALSMGGVPSPNNNLLNFTGENHDCKMAKESKYCGNSVYRRVNCGGRVDGMATALEEQTHE